MEVYSIFANPLAEGLLKQLAAALGPLRFVVYGVATDYCVKATALDAVKAGLATTVLTDAIRGVEVQPGDTQGALDELRAAGAKFADSSSLG